MASAPYYNAEGGNAAPIMVQGHVVQGHQQHGNYGNNPYAGQQGYAQKQQQSAQGGFANCLDQPQQHNNYGGSANYQQQQQHGSAPTKSSSNNHNSNMAQATPYNHSSNPQDIIPANKSESRPCRDVFWAILFYAHLVGMAVLAATYTPTMVSEIAENVEQGGGRSLLAANQHIVARFLDDAGNGGEEQDLEIDPQALLTVLCISSALAFGASSLAMGFMMSFAEALIKMALVFNIILFGGMGLLSLMGGAAGGALMCLMMSAFSAYYAWRVWGRIPFAAANLVTAVTAVRANMGLAFYAYSSLFLLFGWSVFWSVSTISTIYVTNGCDAAGECETELNGGVMFLFLVSYYWTIQVISNVVHVTTAGTVGTWWFAPREASGCCSKAVRDSYVRSMTTSFGSICFGSLIVALLQALKEMIHSARENGEGNALACCAECLLGCIENLVEYFNKWAFGTYN